jgi:co-chaperonin GroES (HSP10)
MIKAITDKIVVQEMKREKSTGGLIIPESVQQPQSFGKIISLGEDVTAPVQIDDVLAFHNNAGMAMVVEGKVLRCLMQNEVYGIVESSDVIDSLSPCEVKQKDLDELDKAIKNAQTQQGGGRIVKI